MDIKIAPPGWDKIVPLDDHPEITCELKRLSFGEQLDVQAGIAKELGASDDIQFASDFGRGIFLKYVRNIAGITYQGKNITRSSELLDGSVPGHPVLGQLFMSCMLKFVDLNIMKDGESKNSEGPSEDGAATVKG